MMRFFLLFIFILSILFVGELTAPVQVQFIVPFTEAIAHLSAGLIHLFDEKIISQGVEIINAEKGFAVSIQAGCNGIEAAIVLIAAMLAFPATWTSKLIGIVIGFMSVQILNILRIISLFYLGQWSYDAFNWAHLYIWQALIMLDVLVVFLIWLKYTPRAQNDDFAK